MLAVGFHNRGLWHRYPFDDVYAFAEVDCLWEGAECRNEAMFVGVREPVKNKKSVPLGHISRHHRLYLSLEGLHVPNFLEAEFDVGEWTFAYARGRQADRILLPSLRVV